MLFSSNDALKNNQDNSSYKIHFYCHNSAKKTLQSDWRKKNDKSISHITGDSNHTEAQTLKIGMFPENQKGKEVALKQRTKGKCLSLGAHILL